MEHRAGYNRHDGASDRLARERAGPAGGAGGVRVVQAGCGWYTRQVGRQALRLWLVLGRTGAGLDSKRWCWAGLEALVLGWTRSAGAGLDSKRWCWAGLEAGVSCLGLTGTRRPARR